MDQQYEQQYKKLNNYIMNQNVPHIIFHGPHCSGKKHMVNNFINMIYNYDDAAKYKYVLYINCTSNKGISMIKDNVIMFAKQQMTKKRFDFKSIVLYDADHLTSDAQYSLRRCIEQYSNNTRFFLVCTNKYNLLNPICSRFTHIYLCNYQKNHIIPNGLNEKGFQHNIITLKSKMKKVYKLNHVDLISFIHELYVKGYTAEQIKLCFRKHPSYNELEFKFKDMCVNFINEEMSMLYVIMFFRSNQDKLL